MTGSPDAAKASVVVNEKKNRYLAIYLGALAALGIGIFVLTHLYHWAFWGWFGGGFLIFAGVASLISMAKTGGAGKVACPSCSGQIDVMNISVHRILPCPHCKTYLEGAQEMAEVPSHLVAKHAVFEAPLPESFEWPAGCPVCGDPATRTTTVEGMSLGGTMAVLVAPVALARVSRVDVPCCQAHDDGVVLFRQGGGTIVAFRSFAYFQLFCSQNEVEPSATVGGYPVGDAVRSTSAAALARVRR